MEIAADSAQTLDSAHRKRDGALARLRSLGSALVAYSGGVDSAYLLWLAREALGDRAGLTRYGHAYVPLDEALSRVVIDLSGRPGLEFHVHFTRPMIGAFDVDLTHEFFQGFVNHALVTLHVDNLRGVNAHHQAETVFKAFAKALRMATTRDARAAGSIPSTKGTL